MCGADLGCSALNPYGSWWISRRPWTWRITLPHPPPNCMPPSQGSVSPPRRVCPLVRHSPNPPSPTQETRQTTAAQLHAGTYVYGLIRIFFFFVCFLRTRVHFRNFLLCCPTQRSARRQVPSQVATHQEIGSQLWAGETPDSNPGLQDNRIFVG